jgi:hypothetical protein
VDRFNERWEESGHHTDRSFYGKHYPPKAELLAARNRVIARHPKTVLVGLHVANHPQNLEEFQAGSNAIPTCTWKPPRACWAGRRRNAQAC